MALGLAHGGMAWDAPFVSLPFPSSETFRFTLGDGLVVIALVLLLDRFSGPKGPVHHL
jgi:hypothetical protein